MRIPRAVGQTLTSKVLLTLFASATFASAQNPPLPDDSITTLKMETKLVAVSAVARDKAGRPVKGLTRDDFILKQDGSPQAIRFFSQGSELPLSLALVVDTSASQTPFIPDEIAAGRVFFHTMLTGPEDRAVLVQVDCDVLHTKLSSAVTVLEDALARLSGRVASAACFGRNGGTLLFDSIVATSQQALDNQIGRRAMVLLTDGGDEGSQANVVNTIEAAQRADIAIYSVFYSGGPGGKIDVLNELSAATGGRVFTVSRTMTLGQIFAEIADELRLQYEIGYRPPDSRADRYHRIEVKATDKTVVVQARAGYFTPKY